MSKKEYEIQPGMVVAPLPQTERGFGLHLGGTLKKEPRLLYCSQNLIIQRNLEELTKIHICAIHGYKTTVGQYSPNGEWICSGDEDGNCKVWAHQSTVIKNEIKVGRKVLDIAWDNEGKRIFAVGAGKDDKGKVFPWNTNNKLGEISGASKGFLCCDFKPNRPFRVIAGAEDYGVYFYKGPPFKFETYDKTHKNYVNCVRYNPSGTFFISCGSDKQILVFDGKEGKKVREIKDKNGHKGTIYEISWSPDGKQFLSASADKTCKLWDFESGTVIHTFSFADKPTKEDMQVSCLWLGDYLLSVSLSGKINFLDAKTERPVKVVTGHRKAISDMALDTQNGYVYTCDADSRVVRTECKTGEASDFVGDPHKGTQIKFLKLNSDASHFWTIGVDDQVVYSAVANLELSGAGAKVEGAARACAAAKTKAGLFIVATHKNKLFVFDGGKIVDTIELGFTPSAASFSPDDAQLALGGTDRKIRLYSVPDMKEDSVIESDQFLKAEITDLAYSSDGKFLSSSDRNRHIWVWDRSNCTEPINKTRSFQFHNAVPSSIAWSPDNKWMVSGGHDNSVYVWTQATEGRNENIKLETAFQSSIRRIAFLSPTEIVGAAADCTIRFFSISKTA